MARAAGIAGGHRAGAGHRHEHALAAAAARAAAAGSRAAAGYCFTALTAWMDYERIQGDVFDHLLAILPELGLRLYQARQART